MNNKFLKKNKRFIINQYMQASYDNSLTILSDLSNII